MLSLFFTVNQLFNYMMYMFSRCFALTSLDLRSFNTTKVRNMSYMFGAESYDTTNMVLSSITISSLWDVTNVTGNTNMFRRCVNLPNYNSSYIDKSMAKPTTQGGYLTLV